MRSEKGRGTPALGGAGKSARVQKRNVRSVRVINVKMGSYSSGRGMDGGGILARHDPFERRNRPDNAM